MASDPAAAGRPAGAAPQFDTGALRSTACSLVSVQGSGAQVDLFFGQRVDQDGVAGAQVPKLLHHVRLARGAAVHLEEVLTRVLGTAAPGGPSRP